MCVFLTRVVSTHPGNGLLSSYPISVEQYVEYSVQLDQPDDINDAILAGIYQHRASSQQQIVSAETTSPVGYSTSY